MQAIPLRVRDYKGKQSGTTFFELLVLNTENGKIETYTAPEDRYNKFRETLDFSGNLLDGAPVYEFQTEIDGGRVQLNGAKQTELVAILSVLGTTK